MRTNLSNRLVNVLLVLFLLCCFALSLSVPAYGLDPSQAVTEPPPPPPPDPLENWNPAEKTDYKARNYWDKFSRLNDKAPTNSTIGEVYLVNTKNQRADGLAVSTTFFTTTDELSLVVQVDSGGRLYLYDYYSSQPQVDTPGSHWLIINEKSLSQAGTYQTPLKKLADQPGKHAFKVWFWDNTTWSQKVIAFNLIQIPTPQPAPASDNKTKLPALPSPQPTSDNKTKPPAKPVIHFFTSEKTTITEGKSQITAWRLSWNVTGAAKITINTLNIPGAQPLEYKGEVDPGQLIVTPTTETVYALTAENEAGTAFSQPVTITPGLPLFLLASIAGAVVVVAGGLSAFLVIRRRRTGGEAEPPPRQAKLLLPNNMAVLVSIGERWLGRIDFARALPPSELKFISREHFLISSEAGKFYIEDSHSDNGTGLNGTEIKGKGRLELHDGDRITIADAITLTFKIIPTPLRKLA